ncbi:MAG TPA: hypothetical protein VL463_30585 [Kofleriaceae bacterium]|nr:hypothetical protein [Kofleriaceae bacterium]
MIRAMLLSLAAMAIGWSCSIETRSGAFRCDNGACPTGRTCEAGWCVSNGTPDAPGGADGNGNADAFVCPPACSSCNGNTCVITCDTAGSCASQVVCPAGFACMVDCAGMNSCAGGVDCSTSSSCSVSCGGDMSCAGATTCGAGACNVSCGGPNSCGGVIQCSSSCKCDTSCGGAGSCKQTPLCPAPTSQCKSGKICTSAPNVCHTC